MILKGSDKEFFTEMGDSIRLFCLKSFYSLFTNMMQNQEIAYTVLDLLFLFGDPVNSKTFFDEETDFPLDSEMLGANLQNSTSSINVKS